jgi:hypothetical protein
LRKLGLEQEQIDAALSRDDTDDAEEETVIEVLESNWIIVDVFQHCTLEEHGVSSQEVRATVALMRVPAREWTRVLRGVKTMSSIICARAAT